MSNVNLAQVCFRRDLLQANEDDAIITSHWASTAGMDHAARLAANGKIKTFMTAIQSVVSNKYIMRDVRWYERDTAAPYGTQYLETIAITSGGGTASGSLLPPQVALSVTFRTSSRKNWGRFYLPGLTSSSIAATTGYVDEAVCDQVANAAQGLTDQIGTSPALVVWSTAKGNYAIPTEVAVDNVPDVIRRRRFHVATYKKIVTAP